MLRTKIKLLAQRKLYSRLLSFKFFVSADSCEAQKFINLGKLPTLIQIKYSNFFQVFVYIFEIHLIPKIFPKYMDPVTSTGWGKKKSKSKDNYLSFPVVFVFLSLNFSIFFFYLFSSMFAALHLITKKTMIPSK